MANDPHDPPAILMVDDEPHILHILRRLPGSQTPDYALITSSSGTEALEQLAGRTVPLVITDMGLPDMSGLQLATAIRARSPSTCIILMSGYLTADLVGRATDYGVAYCLPKPFAFEQVEQ